MSNLIIKFEDDNLAMLRGVLACAAKKDVRHYLKGIHVSRDYVEATDGRRVARFRTPDTTEGYRLPENCSVIIPTFKIAAGTVRICVEITDWEVITVEQYGRAETKTTELFHAIDGRYPDVDRVVPEFGNAAGVTELGVNPILAADIIKATKTATDGPFRFIVPNEAGRALGFEISTLPELKIIIMPMRWQEEQ